MTFAKTNPQCIIPGHNNNYRLPGRQDCPHIHKYGTMICTRSCPFPDKCWVEMTKGERSRAMGRYLAMEGE
jgi:hypothetical protein